MSETFQQQVASTPVVGTPTVNLRYEGTITALAAFVYSSNMTAIYLSGLQVQGTVAAENNIQENIRYTHEANAWTATVYPTVVYLAIQQQEVDKRQQDLISGLLTATAEAPQRELEMQQARALERFGWIEYLLRYAMMLTLCFFISLFGIYLTLRGISLYKLEEVMKRFRLLEEKVIQHTKLNRYRINDFAEVIHKEREQMQQMIVPSDLHVEPVANEIAIPCTPEQLSEIAENVLVKGKTLAYDHYAGNGSLFKRETYMPMYSFFQSQKLAISTGIKNKGIVITTNETAVREDKLSGLAFLEQWHTEHKLPNGFSFATTPLSNTDALSTVQNNTLVHAARVQNDQRGGMMGQFTLLPVPEEPQ